MSRSHPHVATRSAIHSLPQRRISPDNLVANLIPFLNNPSTQLRRDSAESQSQFFLSQCSTQLFQSPHAFLQLNDASGSAMVIVVAIEFLAPPSSPPAIHHRHWDRQKTFAATHNRRSIRKSLNTTWNSTSLSETTANRDLLAPSYLHRFSICVPFASAHLLA